MLSQREIDAKHTEQKLQEQGRIVELRDQTIRRLEVGGAELHRVLLARNEQLKKSLGAVEMKHQHIAALEVQLGELRSKVEAAQTPSQSPDKDLLGLQSRLESEQRQLLQSIQLLQTSQAQIESLEKLLEKATLDHKEQETIAERLRIQNHNLQLGEQDADATIEALRAKVQSLIEEKTNLHPETSCLQEDLESA